jgi:hypothetical protein
MVRSTVPLEDRTISRHSSSNGDRPRDRNVTLGSFATAYRQNRDEGFTAIPAYASSRSLVDQRPLSDTFLDFEECEKGKEFDMDDSPGFNRFKRTRQDSQQGSITVLLDEPRGSHHRPTDSLQAFPYLIMSPDNSTLSGSIQPTIEVEDYRCRYTSYVRRI